MPRRMPKQQRDSRIHPKRVAKVVTSDCPECSCATREVMECSSCSRVGCDSCLFVTSAARGTAMCDRCYYGGDTDVA